MNIVPVIIATFGTVFLVIWLAKQLEKKHGKGWGLIIAIIITIISILCGVANIDRMQETWSFTEVPAYISDISSDMDVHGHGFQRRWTYTLHWNHNNKEYQKIYKDQIDRPDPNITRAWVNNDDTDVSLDHPSVIGGLGLGFIIGSIIGLCWVVFSYLGLQAYLTPINWEKIWCNAMAFVLMCPVGMIISWIAVRNSTERGQQGMFVVFLCFSGGFIVSVVVAIIAKIMEYRQEKAEEKWYKERILHRDDTKKFKNTTSKRISIK